VVLHATQDTLCAVVERDTLRVREVLLFKAACRWSAAECARLHLNVTVEHQRDVLGRALSLIRFPLMTVEEFAQNVAQTGESPMIAGRIHYDLHY